MIDRSAAVAVSGVETITVKGVFERHASPRHRTLTGSAAGGRWGPEGGYPILYLGRPTDSVVIEAHRHLVEPVEGMKPEMVSPRRLLRCRVEISQVLDLREKSNRDGVGLGVSELISDVGDYGPCHRIAQAAHQLGLHGILAPAATGLGETLAIFERRLPASEQPVLIEDIAWEALPADPRSNVPQEWADDRRN